MTIFLLFPTHARLVRHPLFHGRHDIIGSSSSPPLRPITRRMLQPVPPPSLRFGSGRVTIGNSKNCHQRREGSPTLCCSCFGVVRSPTCDGCSRTQSQRVTFAAPTVTPWWWSILWVRYGFWSISIFPNSNLLFCH